MKRKFIVFIAAVFSWSVFFLSSYFYLEKGLSSGQKAVDKPAENIPYFEPPDNCGLLFCLPYEEKLLIYLDFSKEMSYIINIDYNNGDSLTFWDRLADYELDVDGSTLSLLFDRIGGLDLNIEGETLRYTGVQLSDIIGGGFSKELKLDLACAVCEKLAKNGFSEKDLVFLVDNSNTGLDIPTCTAWRGYIRSLFSNAVFINWE